MPDKIAIIAAMKREVRPLVRGRRWRKSTVVDTPYGCFESPSAVVVCAGIGSEAAYAAAEKVLAALRPRLVVSAGLAGALVPGLKVGQIFVPVSIVGSTNEARINLSHGRGDGVLVSGSGIAGPHAKRLLARQYGAQVVDMEAAHVAEVAQRHGIPFVAVKAICDEWDFPMPDMEAFVSPEGRFQTVKFVLHTMVHPSQWKPVSRLAGNYSRAVQQLCRALRNLLEHGSLERRELVSRIAAGPKETRG
ncbi:MAG: phosphorylase [Terriglobales bacterium]